MPVIRIPDEELLTKNGTTIHLGYSRIPLSRKGDKEVKD
jgi:hypothetical protein